MRIGIIGAGGHAKVVADAILEIGTHQISGFFDDAPALWNHTVLDYPVLGAVERWQDYSIDAFVVGIGSNQARKAIFDRLKSAGAKFATIIHPRASVGRGVALEAGVVILANVVLNADTRVHANSILNTACTVDHDCVIGAHVHLAPGVNVAGDVKLGEGVFAGIGAKIVPKISVGDWAIIGAGAVVTRDVMEGAKVVGMPAKAICKVKK